MVRALRRRVSDIEGVVIGVFSRRPFGHTAKQKNAASIQRTEMYEQLTAKAEFAATIRQEACTDILIVTDHKSETYRRMIDVEQKRRVRLDALILSESEFADLLDDEDGNDCKRMARRGLLLRGARPAVKGGIEPPRPRHITEDEFGYNMKRFGFELLGASHPAVRRIRPEYVIAGVMFSRHARRTYSGIPVLLCNAGINYGLLLYLAHAYRFTRILYGMLLDLQAEGKTAMNEAISTLGSAGVHPIMPSPNTVKEALRVYGR